MLVVPARIGPILVDWRVKHKVSYPQPNKRQKGPSGKQCTAASKCVLVLEKKCSAYAQFYNQCNPWFRFKCYRHSPCSELDLFIDLRCSVPMNPPNSHIRKQSSPEVRVQLPEKETLHIYIYMQENDCIRTKSKYQPALSNWVSLPRVLMGERQQTNAKRLDQRYKLSSFPTKSIDILSAGKWKHWLDNQFLSRRKGKYIIAHKEYWQSVCRKVEGHLTSVVQEKRNVVWHIVQVYVEFYSNQQASCCAIWSPPQKKIDNLIDNCFLAPSQPRRSYQGGGKEEEDNHPHTNVRACK